MSTLQVANVWFESTANNRIQYLGANTITISTGGNARIGIDLNTVYMLTTPTLYGTALTISPSTLAPSKRAGINIGSWQIGQDSGGNGIKDFYIYDGTNNSTRLFFDIAGNATFNQNVTAYSDLKLKTDIETIDNALDKVSKMRGVMYTRKDNGARGTGVIAQEMQEVLPEVVHEGENLSVAYGNIVGVLIEAIKELKAEIEQLKGK